MLKHLVLEINKTVSHFSPKVRLNAKKALIISKVGVNANHLIPIFVLMKIAD